MKRIYYQIGAYWRPVFIDEIDSLISAYASKKKQAGQDVFFVNIGANDGVVEDPIASYVKKYVWKGVMVEPVAHLFERLKENYQGFPIQFENKAIYTYTGQLQFYSVAPSKELPAYHERIGSLRKDYLLWHKATIPDLEKYVVEEVIDCLSFDDLTEKYKLSEIQVIIIDTEGADAEILQSIDLKSLGTELIVFEHVYLSFKEYKKVMLFLRKNNFKCFRAGRDTLAIHRALL